jgi:hypothetical protein
MIAPLVFVSAPLLEHCALQLIIGHQHLELELSKDILAILSIGVSGE